MVMYNLKGYYEVVGMNIIPKSGAIKFKLGQFFPLGDSAVKIADRMRHGELLNLKYVLRLYNKEI